MLVLLILLIFLMLLMVVMFDVRSIVWTARRRALAGDAVDVAAGCVRIFVHPLVHQSGC